MPLAYITFLPPEIILEIAIHLELSEVISLLATCTVLQKLSASRSLWIDVLTRTHKHRALACPVGSDITQLDIDDLYRVAHHTHHVGTTWSHDFPTPITVRSKNIGLVPEPMAILAMIPGTSVVVLYARESGHLICCDLDSVERPEIINVGKIRRRAHYNEFGRHLIALSTGDGHVSRSLHVFTLSYGGGRPLRIKETFTAPTDRVRALFIYQNVVGIIQFPDDDGFDTLLPVELVDLRTGATKRIQVNMRFSIMNSHHVFSSVTDNKVFFIVADDHKYCIFKCPPEMTAFSAGGSTIEKAPHDPTLIGEVNYAGSGFSGCHNIDQQWTRLGFHQCYAYSFQYDEEILVETYIHISLFPGNHGEITLRGRIPAYDQGAPWLLAWSPSGAYCIVITDCDTLHLLSFHQEHPLVRSHQLVLPSDIDLEEVYSIAIDERCGMICLALADGGLFAISYLHI